VPYDQSGDDVARVLAALDAHGLSALLRDLCGRRGVLPEEVCGRRRTLSVARARHELWWRIRNHPNREYSYLEIAHLFGRDHTTVMHGIAAHLRRSCP
jgi:chromosomal replication initiation ATPase DnaA